MPPSPWQKFQFCSFSTHATALGHTAKLQLTVSHIHQILNSMWEIKANNVQIN